MPQDTYLSPGSGSHNCVREGGTTFFKALRHVGNGLDSSRLALQQDSLMPTDSTDNMGTQAGLTRTEAN